MKQIKNEQIIIQKCEQLKNRLLLAIDGGDIFTKVLFLNKTNKEQLFNDDEVSLKLEFSLFNTEDFEYAIEWVRDNAYLPEDNTHSIHVTGSYAILHQNKIKSVLNKDILPIDEVLAVSVGCKSAIECIGVDNLCVKYDQTNPFAELDNDMINKFVDSWRKRLNIDKDLSNNLFPSLFHFQGSRSLTYSFNENGVPNYLNMLHPGGQTFLGLSKCLLNTNNYNEIVNLASEGNRCNVDTQCKEVFDSDIKSPYGKFPSDMPMFSFGKCMDYDKDIELPKKEDLAVSLMSFHCQYIFMYCSLICLIKRITKVYLSGNLFSSPIFQREFYSLPFIKITAMNFEVLNFAFSGALGAMICDDNNATGLINNV